MTIKGFLGRPSLVAAACAALSAALVACSSDNNGESADGGSGGEGTGGKASGGSGGSGKAGATGSGGASSGGASSGGVSSGGAGGSKGGSGGASGGSGGTSTPRGLSGDVTDSDQAGPTVAGCPVFPADNAWNQPVNALPVAKNSAALIARIGLSEPVHPDFGTVYDGAPS